MANSIITQADIQNYAPELDLSAYSATTISGMCSRATNRAAQFCSVDGFDLIQSTGEVDKARISNTGELMISTRRRPIVSVTSISLQKGSFTTSLTLNDTSGNPLYQVPHPGNKLVFPNTYFYATGTYLAGGSTQLLSLRGAGVFYNISYLAGFQTPPDDLKYAVMLYFRDEYLLQYNTKGLSGFTQGSYSESFNNNANAKGRTALIMQAEDALTNGGYQRSEW
jgi:hypothetical protein